ncbi:aldehyde ferredoxin oxidoreductase family protein [Candidatus Solincola tengchongensis]|uniref:aldehyde ferredoxin oxidoreductase family protein n=1 Tax=Candidatus Solincola tengchongensis TaxID=2900693 RepID=UPI00257F4B89|nr:aldehyde ferredoxin oxidoreductase family protein [Candidatus Solincola tengchongensis]
MDGWMGRMLEVDLGKRAFRDRELDPELLTRWLGGRGLGVKLLFDSALGVEPLHPSNPLIFAVGPLTGTPVPTAGRFSLVSRSPLTGTVFDCNSGGRWGVALKRCGLDVLMVTGRSPEPVYLEVSEEGARLHPADHLWGKRVSEVMARLGGAHPGAGVAAIGPAGENGSLMASVMNDGARALGRGGLGAVMGSKNLKAVVVRGRNRVSVSRPEKLSFVLNESRRWIKGNPVTAVGLPRFGTAVLVNLMNELGVFPANNFQYSRFPEAESISGEALEERYLVKRRSCWGCPIGCGRVTRAGDLEGEGPEYETLWALGAQCGVGDLEKVVLANYLCNDLGLDTISAGSVIGCCMELSQRGLVEGGPRFGDADAVLGLLEDMALGRGLGKELAQGARRFARHRGAGEYAMQVKGLELPAYDPRGLQGQGLSFATSNRGGCHLRAYLVGPEVLGIPKMVDRHSTMDKPGLTIFAQNLNASVDSLVLCRFLQFALSDEYFARMLEAVTGVPYKAADLHRIGERIWNLERLYNLRCGMDPAEDTLPLRLLREPASEGPAAGRVVLLEEMLPLYYRARGWDERGIPEPQKLASLGLAP